MIAIATHALSWLRWHAGIRPTPEGKPASITYISSTSPSRSRKPRRAA